MTRPFTTVTGHIRKIVREGDLLQQQGCEEQPVPQWPGLAGLFRPCLSLIRRQLTIDDIDEHSEQ